MIPHNSKVSRHGNSTCRGVPLNWPLPNLFQTYPFLRHEQTSARSSYQFCRVGAHAEDFWIQSEGCTRNCTVNGAACVECEKLPALVAHLASVANHAAPGTKYNLLSGTQLQRIARDKDDRLRSLRLDVSNLIAHDSKYLP